MNSLEIVALNSSQWLWDELEEGLKLDAVLHEVACTDFFLKKLRKEGGMQLIVETVTDEISVGADWEWWFMTESGYALPLRVQAKVMYMQAAKTVNRSSNPIYKKLHYRPKKSFFSQTETLIQRSISDGMLPLYCLYTHFNDHFIAKNVSSNCRHYPAQPSAFGVSIVGAETVLVTKELTLSHLFPEVHGFPCIFSSIRSLLHLERRLHQLWPANSKMFYSGQDRNGSSLPMDNVRQRDLFIRSPDDVPEYVRLLHGRALERLALLTSDFQNTGDYEEGQESFIEEDTPLYTLPRNTGRASVYLIPDIGLYPGHL